MTEISIMFNAQPSHYTEFNILKSIYNFNIELNFILSF